MKLLARLSVHAGRNEPRGLTQVVWNQVKLPEPTLALERSEGELHVEETPRCLVAAVRTKRILPKRLLARAGDVVVVVVVVGPIREMLMALVPDLDRPLKGSTLKTWIDATRHLRLVQDWGVDAGAGAGAGACRFRVPLSIYSPPDSALAGRKKPDLLVSECVKTSTFTNNKRSQSVGSRGLVLVHLESALLQMQVKPLPPRYLNRSQFGRMVCSGLASDHRVALVEHAG